MRLTRRQALAGTAEGAVKCSRGNCDGGELALVTGAGVRLGRALAEGLAGEGMRLALHYHQHGAQAEELAHLFGAPKDPAWTEGLMADSPESLRLPPRAADFKLASR